LLILLPLNPLLWWAVTGETGSLDDTNITRNVILRNVFRKEKSCCLEKDNPYTVPITHKEEKMDLDQYIRTASHRLERHTLKSIAAKIAYTPQYLSLVALGLACPGRKLCDALEKMSDGLITEKDMLRTYYTAQKEKETRDAQAHPEQQPIDHTLTSEPLPFQPSTQFPS
jgi:hypothetical protein